VKVADTSLCVFVNVMTSNEVPPALILPGVNVLDTCGRLGETVSISATVQVPAKQPVAVLVLVTLGGAEMDAVLVICVCALAICGTKRLSSTPSTSADAPDA
jgi:di/tricarboxylate transporter